MPNYIANFTVSGHGSFPVDMLQHDACYPTSTEDALRMADHLDRHNDDYLENVEINLTGCRSVKMACTPDRWVSFGWQVVRSNVRKA